MSFFQAKSYINYWLRQIDEYSLHSPFVFDLYRNVFKAPSPQNQFQDIAFVRSKMEHDHTVINRVTTYGSSSKVTAGTSQTISEIAGRGITRSKYSELLFRLCIHAEAQRIVELGTSIGINTLYLAQVPGSQVSTFEGNPEIIKVAEDNFKSVDQPNISIIEGNIDKILKHQIDLMSKVDFAYIDANHRKEPTVTYFNTLSRKTHDQSFIAIDDIHRSKEMEQAWEQIIANPLVKVSVDIFQMGLVYFDPDLDKKHYILSF